MNSVGTPNILAEVTPRSRPDHRSRRAANKNRLLVTGGHALYRSFVEQQRLEEQRSINKMDQSFEANQSFPKMRGPQPRWSSQQPENLRKKTPEKRAGRSKDHYKGTEPDSVSFSCVCRRSSSRRLEPSASQGSLLSLSSPALSGRRYNTAVAPRALDKAVITVNSRTKQILIANDMACKLLGLDHKKLIGRSLTEFCCARIPEEQKINGPLIVDEQLIHNDKLSTIHGKVVELLNADGQVVPVAVWSYSLGSPRRPASRHNTVDARVSVRSSASGSTRWVLMLEPVERVQCQCTLGPDGRIFVADDALAQLIGYGQGSDMLGLKINTFLESMELDAPEPVVDHCCAKLVDGTQVPVTTKLVAHTDDETDEVLKYELTVYCYTKISGVVTFTGDGTLNSFNPHFINTLLGYTLDELKGKSITDIIPNFYRDSMCVDQSDMPLPPLDQLDSPACTDNAGTSPICDRLSQLRLDDKSVSHLLTSTPAPQSDAVRDGAYWGQAKHKCGAMIAVGYRVQRVSLKDGCTLHTITICRQQAQIHRPQCNGDLDSSCAQSDVGDECCPESLAEQSVDLSVCASGAYAAKYDTLEHVGKGAFGSVKLASNKTTDTTVITKFICKSRVLVDSWVKNDRFSNGYVPMEVDLLSKLNHPNIVKVVDIFENDLFYQLVMEKHGQGIDLFDFIDRQPYLDEALISYMFRQIVSAVAYLHRMHIVHRDIKDENVILDERFRCKLIDFGSAATFGDGKLFSTFCGTIEYCSPEVLTGNRYAGPELEMWSLGILLYTLVFGENPFRSAEDTIEGDLDVPWHVSEGLEQLISWLLHPLPQYRATVSDLQKHWWLSQPVNIESYRFEEVLPNNIELNGRAHNDEE